jgi:transcriptional regulator with XRE-family HTH domain
MEKQAKGGNTTSMQKQQIMQATADRIRHLRKQKDISQEELALRAGINTVYFGQIERGQKCPTVDTLYKIAVGLEIPLPDLLRFNTQTADSEDVDINAYMEQLIKRIPPNKASQVIRILEAVIDLL